MELNLNAAQKLSESENAGCKKISEGYFFSESIWFPELSV